MVRTSRAAEGGRLVLGSLSPAAAPGQGPTHPRAPSVPRPGCPTAPPPACPPTPLLLFSVGEACPKFQLACLQGQGGGAGAQGALSCPLAEMGSQGPRTPTLAPWNSSRISSCQCLLGTLGPQPTRLQTRKPRAWFPSRLHGFGGPQVPICNNGSKEAGKTLIHLPHHPALLKACHQPSRALR